MSTTPAPALTVLHLGCGRRKGHAASGFALTIPGTGAPYPGAITWIDLDGNPDVTPDVVCVLGVDPIPLADDTVDFALASHVIEHIGEIGKVEGWFYFWEEVYRVLKPGGKVQFECPYYASCWAWADPTHIRAISTETFIYLNQDAYTVGGSIPDYRPPFDFELSNVHLRADEGNAEIAAREPVSFINGTLTARKPLNKYWERGA